MTDITDEMLTAYLDGELSGDELRKVEEAIETDARLPARIEALDVPRDEIKAAFDDMLLTSPAVPEIPSAAAPTRHMAPLAMAASLVLGVAIGAWWFGSQSTGADDWKVAVAQYQVLYVPETLIADAPSQSAIEENLQVLSANLGRDLSNAQDANGLEFRRAQMLGLNGSPLVQMAYVSSDGVPFAICVTEVGGGDQSVQTDVLEGLASAYWTDGGYGFLVIGGNDIDFVNSVASDLIGQI